MAIGPRLELRQTQTLVMTPQLRQAIKLLQFSNIEVAAFIEEELERNPLLERDDTPDVPHERPALDQRVDGREDGRERGAAGEELPAADNLLDSGMLPTDGSSPLDTDPAEQFDGAAYECGSGFDRGDRHRGRHRDRRRGSRRHGAAGGAGALAARPSRRAASPRPPRARRAADRGRT